MINATHMPHDPYGNMIPVACHKTRATQVLTLTDSNDVYLSDPFSSKDEVLASHTTAAAGGESITFTSKLKGHESEDISIEIKPAGAALAVTVTGKAIEITPKADSTSKQIKTAIDANVFANNLVSVEYTDEDAVIENNKPKAYLDGWDKGNTGIYVCIFLEDDGFIGTFTEAKQGVASMPIAAGERHWEYVMPGHKIAVQGTVDGSKAYLTPAKQM